MDISRTMPFDLVNKRHYRSRIYRIDTVVYEKAGVQKIAEQQTIDTVSKVSNVLLELGFDLQLLGSERFVLGKLESLGTDQMCKLKETFLRCPHLRFKREFAASRHQPYGKTSECQTAIQNADPTILTKLVRLVRMLKQTKAYLFWSE
jgi:hypothetical protein